MWFVVNGGQKVKEEASGLLSYLPRARRPTAYRQARMRGGGAARARWWAGGRGGVTDPGWEAGRERNNLGLLNGILPVS